MVEFRYGPVEIYLVGLEGERPDPAVVGALTEMLEGGLIRLLDVVIISKDDDGQITVTEIEDQTEEYGFGGVELAAVGIAADDDIEELAQLVPAGSSAAIVAITALHASPHLSSTRSSTPSRRRRNNRALHQKIRPPWPAWTRRPRIL